MGAHQWRLWRTCQDEEELLAFVLLPAADPADEPADADEPELPEPDPLEDVPEDPESDDEGAVLVPDFSGFSDLATVEVPPLRESVR